MPTNTGMLHTALKASVAFSISEAVADRKRWLILLVCTCSVPTFDEKAFGDTGQLLSLRQVHYVAE